MLRCNSDNHFLHRVKNGRKRERERLPGLLGSGRESGITGQRGEVTGSGWVG